MPKLVRGTLSRLHRPFHGLLDICQFLGRAELDDLGALVRLGGVSWWQVEGIAGLDNLLVIVVADDQPTLDDGIPSAGMNSCRPVGP